MSNATLPTIKSREKKPTEVLDYMFDWNSADEGGPWLPTGDTIVTSSWAISAVAGTDTCTIQTDSKTATTTTVWLTGGTVDEKRTLTNTIVTVAGRTGVHKFDILIKA